MEQKTLFFLDIHTEQKIHCIWQNVEFLVLSLVTYL